LIGPSFLPSLLFFGPPRKIIKHVSTPAKKLEITS
jgi:hypothetical protein